MHAQGEVLIDFGQFYVYDANTDGMGSEDPPTQRHEFATGVWTGRSTLAVFAPRQHGLVPVRIEVHPEAPRLEVATWDNVVETSLNLPSGTVMADSWESDACIFVALTTQPGSYRVRILGRGFDHAAEEDEGDEYLLQLWPAPPAPPVGVRVWKGFSQIFGGT